MRVSVLARLRSLLRGVRGGTAIDADMDAEFRAHMALRADHLVRQGMTPEAARRRAAIEFGSPEMHKDEGRRQRGLAPWDRVHVSWLDFKLGFRMLARYPGITLVGGFAMAFAVWVGAGVFEIGTQVAFPRLPLPQGERVVGLRLWDVQANRQEPRLLRDLAEWKRSLKTVTDVGAFRILPRNLIVASGAGEPIEVGEVDPSLFRVGRVAPLLGRTLVEEDGRPGAPSVAVIGWDVWRRRFDADPRIVGRGVRLGDDPVTIVGVMPEGFAFPIAQSFWTPLRADPLAVAPREGPPLRVFARLADWATLEDAQAELDAQSRRRAADWPATHARLRAQVLPFARSIIDLRDFTAYITLGFNAPILLLLVLVCGNVGLLMFARAATREAELVVRTALGATRARLVTQLFAEALVLGGLATAVGLFGANTGIRWVLGVAQQEANDGRPLPFWFRAHLSPHTIAYAVLLALLCALLAGALPALRATRGLGGRLKALGAGGGGMRLGGVWTVVIVVQVAVTIATPVMLWALRRDEVATRSMDLGFAEHEYLTLRLGMDRLVGGQPADTSRARLVARYERAVRELGRRLTSESGVIAVASADRLPRMYHPARLVDIDSGGAAPLDPHYPAYRVSNASVAPGFFATLETPILVGRDFTAAEHERGREPVAVPEGEVAPEAAAGGPVVVNESFVKLVLGGRNPIGRRLRYRMIEEWPKDGLGSPDAPWYEIVGVVHDLGTAKAIDTGGDPKVAAIYHPVPLGATYPAMLAVHVRGEPTAFAARARALAAEVDATLRVYEPRPLPALSDPELYFLSFWFRLVATFAGIALTLSLAGIYAVTSFAVARRTREIGIRIALGASRWRVVVATFRRPVAQVALGVAAGFVLIVALIAAIEGARMSRTTVALCLAYSLGMFAVCLLACVVPTRRALAVEPTEALRAEG